MFQLMLGNLCLQSLFLCKDSVCVCVRLFIDSSQKGSEKEKKRGGPNDSASESLLPTAL